MQEQISLERQIRDNTETEKEIKELESKLAYLQRDTTGSNAQEILKLQEEGIKVYFYIPDDIAGDEELPILFILPGKPRNLQKQCLLAESV